jgi:polyisoprenoid-binding protein YceI
VHAIHGRAGELGGTVDADVVDGRIQGPVAGRLEVPVKHLRSGNPLNDAELQRRVDARRHPNIVGEIRNATPLGDDGRFRVEGDLNFHGVTKTVTGEIQISVDDDRLIIAGEQVFDIRDFGIKPPRILMLRVEPEVHVEIKLVAEPA